MIDPLAHLATLPTAEASAARSERIRRRALQTLRRHGSRAARLDSHDNRGSATSSLWLAGAASLGLAYLAEVVNLAVRVFASR